ncbi:MAG: L,D-transpeptidase family protein [Thermodesulfovibrionales bacterium]
MARALALVAALVLLPGAAAASGGAWSYADDDSVIGLEQSYQVKPGESLHEIARRFGLGFNEIAAANPGVDPWVPAEGRLLSIPTRWVLPDAPREGIVINLAEMRLYHFVNPEGARLVKTYPIGIGREGFDTPTGEFSVVQKIKDPPWIVPESIRAEKPELPAVVPPGPDNPLGSHAMRLSNPSYLIHGTNRPFGVGWRASHGCIRLYPEDIGELYQAAKDGEKVRIVYQPVKAGVEEGKVYVEVHGDYLEPRRSPFKDAVPLLKASGLLDRIDKGLLRKALAEKTGAAVSVSAGAAPGIETGMK